MSGANRRGPGQSPLANRFPEPKRNLPVMASPFRIFRKHQKQMLAILTVLAMFAFVFMGQKGCDYGMSRGPANPVVVTTSQFGSLRQSDLQNMIALHDRPASGGP
jgi:hypothetical protein